MKLTYPGAFKQALLMDELLAAFPEWWVDEEEQRHCLLTLEGNAEGVRLTVPDDADEDAIAAVVAAHNPAVLSAGEVLEAEGEDAGGRLLALIDAALADYALALSRWDALTAAQLKAVVRRNMEVLVQVLRYHRRELA